MSLHYVEFEKNSTWNNAIHSIKNLKISEVKIMSYYVKFFNANGENPCGSSWNHIVSDLKTVKGVSNRVKNYPKPNGYSHYEIYRYTNLFNEKTFTLVASGK